MTDLAAITISSVQSVPSVVWFVVALGIGAFARHLAEPSARSRRVAARLAELAEAKAEAAQADRARQHVPRHSLREASRFPHHLAALERQASALVARMQEACIDPALIDAIVRHHRHLRGLGEAVSDLEREGRLR